MISLPPPALDVYWERLLEKYHFRPRSIIPLFKIYANEILLDIILTKSKVCHIMDAVNAIECLIDQGVISEEKGAELISIVKSLPDFSEAVKILLGNNIILSGGLSAQSFDGIISENDSITDIGPVIPGRLYLLTVKGEWGDGQIEVFNNNGPADDFIITDNGQLSSTLRTEVDVSPSENTIRLELTGATDPSLRYILVPKPQ